MEHGKRRDRATTFRFVKERSTSRSGSRIRQFRSDRDCSSDKLAKQVNVGVGFRILDVRFRDRNDVICPMWRTPNSLSTQLATFSRSSRSNNLLG
jgi:hypothetical protein